MSTQLTVQMLTDEQRALIHDSRSPYTAEDRVACAMCYLVSGGNAEEAARKATLTIGQEVNAGTLRQWKSRATWFPEAEEIARKMLQQDLDRKYTRFLYLTEKEMVDRVLNGDEHVTKDGSIIRVKPKLRDLINSHGVVSDKRAMLRGEPTSRKEDTGLAALTKLVEVLQSHGEKMLPAIEGSYEVIEDA